MYIQLSSSAPLSTLQTYESTLHSLAVSAAIRSTRFQPAKPTLRAFAHSLAADWGFATESFDPEPHRHVFVLKPTSWTPPTLGIGNPAAPATIGIGGISVGECVKLRERQRMKEREAQRIAAIEAKTAREAAKAQQQLSTGADGDGGWAQVAASRKANPGSGSVSGSGSGSNTPNTRNGTVTLGLRKSKPLTSSSVYAALAGGADDTFNNNSTGGSTASAPRKERLVLRSGVGAGKQLKSQGTAQSQDVADDWEEEEEKEEKEEREREQKHEQTQEQEQAGQAGKEIQDEGGEGSGNEGEGKPEEGSPNTGSEIEPETRHQSSVLS